MPSGKLLTGLMISISVLVSTCGQPPSLLEEVRALGKLRVITRNSPTSFYTGSSGPEGPEFDLMKGFAEHIEVELKLETSKRFSGLIPAVESGRAHVAAAGLTPTPERAKHVDFGPAYHNNVRQFIIYKLGTNRPRDIDDLLGKKLEVVAGSSYIETLKDAQRVRPNLTWIENPHADLAELLTAVVAQDIHYTMADSTLFNVYRNYVPEIRVGFEIKMGESLAWAFPKRHDRSLIESAEAYLEKIRHNGEYDKIMDRYYGHTRRFDYVGTRTLIRDYKRRLPTYRDMFEAAGNKNKTDWKLLAAIGYQESHWNPNAVSPTGVRGIMMLTSRTARVMKVNNRTDPRESINGGAAYLARIRARLPELVKEPDRTWFALAAYNVGYGHVQDAREITRKLGEDPDSWINVRRSLRRLTQKKWYSQTKHGYARGWEPVMYVENIRNYLDILTWLTKQEKKPLDQHQPVTSTIARNNNAELTEQNSRERG
ncbi:MAG: membrane-bound lytic murein transglycosylase MltF [Gammaproteobacteria bacterium]|nr:membrane-bound lytic murein transglycosylase MltF [Gammaproteobacteria bacterium]MDP7154034.1 membrane-bound lytic murein transglycosylase MltF [Gammaproteobacteria bacterium]